MSKRSEPSQRQLRVGELMRHGLSEVFITGETGDPDLEKAGVTVQEVSMSPDLKQARVYVRPLIQDKARSMMAALKTNRKYIRKLMAAKLDLKYLPNMRFELDAASDHAARINQLLHDPKVARDLHHDDE